MTLTEEQREATRAVSDLPRAIGCTQCHSYIQEHYGNQFAILRAMIDSSEQFNDATKLIGFDLERARGLRDFLQDDCAEVGDVWAEMIAEIERLRGEMENYGDDYVCQMKSKDARIQELEDALIEQEARFQYYVQNENCESWPEARRRYPELNEKYLKIARQHLHAEGKIGPDADAKPHCWQITEERKAAIRDAEIALRDAVLDSNDPHCWDAETAVLRAMLEEAE